MMRRRSFASQMYLAAKLSDNVSAIRSGKPNALRGEQRTWHSGVRSAKRVSGGVCGKPRGFRVAEGA